MVISKIVTPASVTEESNLLLSKLRQMFPGHDDFSVDGNHPEIVEYQCEGYICCKDLLDEGNSHEVRIFLQGWMVNIK